MDGHGLDNAACWESWSHCRRSFLERCEASPRMSRQQNSPASWVSSHQGQHSSLFRRRPERSESVWATSRVSPIVSMGSAGALHSLSRKIKLLERSQAMWWKDDWRCLKKFNDFKSEGLFKLKKLERTFQIMKGALNPADRQLTVSWPCQWTPLRLAADSGPCPSPPLGWSLAKNVHMKRYGKKNENMIWITKCSRHVTAQGRRS